MKKLTLPDGATYCFNAANERVCTGSQMGRRNCIPPDSLTFPAKLRMERLRMVYGDYDYAGAYWGHTQGTAIYWAYGDCAEEQAHVFVRASSREDAKAQVRAILPRAPVSPASRQET